MTNSSSRNQVNEAAIRWITARELARLTGIAEQTLRNWAYLDRRAGCEGGRPGYPRWKRFGKCVRYKVVGGEPEVA